MRREHGALLVERWRGDRRGKVRLPLEQLGEMPIQQRPGDMFGTYCLRVALRNGELYDLAAGLGFGKGSVDLVRRWLGKRVRGRTTAT